MLNLCKHLSVLAMMCILPAAHAEIRISDDWPQDRLSIHEQHQLPLEKDEHRRMRMTADVMCAAQNASIDPKWGKPDYDQYFMLFMDGVKYYMQGAMFMSKTRPDEKCTPIHKALAYRCEEGQHYKQSAHLLFMDSNFQDAGVYKVKINTPHDVFVNAMLALGIANKIRNELLLTVQYFPIDGKGAHTIAEVGNGWKRMTILLRLKAVDGKIEVEQDDSCLGNPNNYETIPDARKALKRCMTK